MTLNLSHLRHEVKPTAMALVPNPNHPLGMGLAYKQLKALGWVNRDSEIHPTERVPVFRLGAASVRRNKSGRSHWLIEIAGETYEADGDAATVTAAVKEKLAGASAQPDDPTPDPPASGTPEGVRPPTPAQQIAADIKAEAPWLNGRVEAGLALYEARTLEFPKYHTRMATANGGKPNRDCDCPDATYRGFRAGFGIGCKHTIAQEIAWRVDREQNAVAQRELMDLIEGRRQRCPEPVEGREQALPAALTIGESIEAMLGYDVETNRAARDERSHTPVRQPTTEESRRGLAAALSPGGGGPLHRSRAQFEVRYGRR